MESWSADMDAWLALAPLMKAGVDPYRATGSLNWPPLWMQVVFLLSHVSVYTGLRLVRVIQLFLILTEAILTGAAYLLLSRHWPTKRAFLVVLLGLVFNPVAIILNTVHGNFDVIVGLLVLLFVWALTSYHRTERPEDWLLACLFLGLGILTKTTPVVLLPLLMVGIRHLNPRHVILGACLVAGPTVLGMSVLVTLGGHQVLDRVLSYRSYGGTFGITGLFNLFHWPYPSWVAYSPGGTPVYVGVFGLVMTAAGCAVVYLGVFRNRSLLEYHELLIAAALLIAVPVLGPGYATQYAWWWIPVLVFIFALGGTPARIVCVVLYVVASATYAVEYGLEQPFGQVALRWPHPAWFQHWSQAFNQPTTQTVFRLPIFAAYLAFLWLAVWTVARQASRRPGLAGAAATRSRTGGDPG